MNCTHHFIISSPVKGGHIIGKCKWCGKEKDFTELQEQDKGYRQLCLANALTRPGIDMSQKMAVKKPKNRPCKLSRGRVR